MTSKACNSCKTVHPVEHFHVRRASPDGLCHICKTCSKAKHAKYYQDNREKFLADCAARYRANPEPAKRRSAKWYEDNRPAALERCKEYAQKTKAHRNRKLSERLKSDPSYKVAVYTRTRVLAVLKGGRKSAGTEELLGASHETVVAHLASKFQPGMTWENQGKHGWHIDHIRPCSSFDLTDPAQQRACFHYTNLQPMWAKDNLRKGAKWREAAA